ncbi:MAG: hemerythrin domain-containing protein [Hyphomonadaceae bacterium]|nr:hemerythrin domain-containing protein [Hyphomonadaceae bacterium]
MATRKSKTNGAIDAIALLKADHRAVEDLFEKFEESRGKATKAKIAQQICMELCIHTAIEEEIFYPSIQGEVEDDILDEAYVEHDGAKMLIAEIMAGSPDDQFFDAKVKVLAEEIKHHVKEEEQRDGMFAQARKADVDLMELGARMQARKDELKRAYMRDGMPTPMTRSMSGAKVTYGQPVA